MVNYSSDKPISDTNDDLYSRDGYAQKLADLLCDIDMKDDFVVGLYSPWGYGKTSTLQMVGEHIGDRAIVVPFNPWIFDNPSAIVTALLFRLAKELDGTQTQTRGQKMKARFTKNGSLTGKDTAAKLVGDYAGIVGLGASFGTGNPLAGAAVGKAAELAEKYIKASSVDDIKIKIEKKIHDSGKRVIIVIDDVDRLDKEEVFQLFKLIKIIADFKGVTYLVAFDDEAVASAINDRFSSSRGKEAGRSFLEKIIQVPLHLPLIQSETLNTQVFTGIDEILRENGVEISDEGVRDFRLVYDSDIASLVDTPRTVNRYLNSLKFTFALVKEEVNVADFLIVEALRLFYPGVYSKLRNEMQLLTGTEDRFVFDDGDKKQKIARIEKITDGDEAALEIIKTLFPAINKLYEQHASGKSLSELRADRRVASPDYYDRYFSYGVIASDISDTEVLQILSLSTAPEIAEKIIPILERKDQQLILAKLRMYYKNATNPIELAKALLLAVNKLSTRKKSVFSDTPVEESADIIMEIIKNQPERLKNLQAVISECSDYEQLFFLIREVVLNSKEDSRERILDTIDLKEFEKTALLKISTEAKKNVLHRKDSLAAHILYQYWAEMGSRKDVDKYLKATIKDTDSALDFMTLHLGRWTGGGGSHRGDFDRAAYSQVEKLIDMKYLYNLIIKKYPEHKGTSEFPDFRHSEDNIARTGNEDSEEFRSALAQQLIYLYEHPVETA